MDILKQFRKEVLTQSCYSFDARRKLHKKIKKFNTKHKVNLWIDSIQKGESDNYVWVIIRTGGKYGDIVYEKKLRKISQTLLNKIEVLKKRGNYKQTSLIFE